MIVFDFYNEQFSILPLKGLWRQNMHCLVLIRAFVALFLKKKKILTYLLLHPPYKTWNQEIQVTLT